MMDARSSSISASGRTPEERALEAGFVAHSEWAFEAAYFAYRGLLYGAAYKVLADPSAAEDCVHDVLMRLWHRAGSYTSARGSLRAFLCVCVRNEALTRLRRARTRGRIDDDQARNTPVSQMMEDQTVASMDLQHSLTSLSDVQRETIRLAYYEGLTHEEIARRLDEPVGTVKSRISNSLRRLRVVLAGGAAQ